MNSSLAYGTLQILTGVAMVGLGVAYGYENYRGDQCIASFNQLSENNQIRITDLQARIDKVRAREASLQARTNELIKDVNKPDAGAKKD
jgi:cell division protein FtsB